MKNLILGTIFSVIFALPFANLRADQVTYKKSDDLFVRFDPKTSATEIRRVLKSDGLKIVWKSKLVPHLYRVEPSLALSGVSIDSLQTKISNNSSVLYAEPNVKIHRKIERPASFRAEGAEGEKKYNKQWALNGSNGLNPSDAWGVSKGLFTTKVAIIDTGVDHTHFELKDRTEPGFDFIENKPLGRDLDGHGTHVAGVIGGAWNGQGMAGINEKVTIIPIRAVPNDDDETDSDLIESFEFAVAQGARVANCSFGKSTSSQAVGDVIEAAGRKGLLVVVAAGNETQDLNFNPTYPASFKTSNMIVVGATHELGGLAYFSNFGVSKVDIASPGHAIFSTILRDRFDSWDGTSMATPQVTGAAALLISARPDLTPYQVKEALLSTARRTSRLNGLVDTGLLDLSAAMKKALTF